MKRMPMIVLGLVALATAGCFKKKDVMQIQQVVTRELEGIVEREWARLKEQYLGLAQQLQPVYFEFDSERLSDAARDTLAKNAEILKSIDEGRYVIEGHCDDRGTTAYNLALGEKRAQAIVNYYSAMGVPSKRLQWVTFGEERPSCTNETEECWRENRRGLTIVLLP